MVDVGAKAHTARRAVAEAFVALAPETLSLVIDGRNAKGDVLTVAPKKLREVDVLATYVDGRPVYEAER